MRVHGIPPWTRHRIGPGAGPNPVGGLDALRIQSVLGLLATAGRESLGAACSVGRGMDSDEAVSKRVFSRSLWAPPCCCCRSSRDGFSGRVLAWASILSCGFSSWCNKPTDVWRPAAVAGAAWGMALLVCAASLLPLLEYLPQSEQFVRRPGGAAAVEFAPANAYISFWLPRFFGAPSDGNYWGDTSANFVNTLYIGMVTWVGLALLLARRPARGTSARVLSLAIAAVFCAAMAFPLPGIRWIQELPILDSMWRFYYLPFALLAGLVLGASGIHQWFACSRKPGDLKWPRLSWRSCSGSFWWTGYFALEDLIYNECLGMSPFRF